MRSCFLVGWMVVFLCGCSAQRFLVPASALQERSDADVTAAVAQGPVLEEQGSTVEPPVSSETEDGLERVAVERLEQAPRAVEKIRLVDPAERFSNTDKIAVAAEAMPLKDLLNYVFGQLLKVNFVVAAEAPGFEQAVTLNAPTALSSRALFRLISEMLAERGVGITLRDDVYFIAPVAGRSGSDLPIGFGRRDADVPEAAGKILHVIPLRFGSNQAIERTLRDLLGVQFFIDAAQSALFVTADRPVILKTLEIVRLFDQPSLRASRVGIINLTYVDTKEFIDQVGTLLENEGIPAGKDSSVSKSVSFVPIDQLGSVVVFTATSEVLDRVEFWARQIDRPSQGPALRYFVYQPKFARAIDLGESLAPLIGSSVNRLTPSAGNAPRDTRSAMGTGGIDSTNVLRRDSQNASPAATAVSVEGDGIRLSIDSRANSLVFFTSGLRYETLLPTIRRLDVPPKQVMLEATIAEVSLTGEFALGVEFALKGSKWEGGTQFGLPSGGAALTYLGGLTDQFRLKLSANDSQVQILSRPTLLVRDGLEATISVGNDVPTVGATASDPLESDRQVTTVLYRKTGLDLGIRPTINAQGTVILQIKQTISNSVPGSSGVQGAPIFFERSVTTEVVANSGAPVLLAGLVSDAGSTSSTNFPVLSKIPLLGQFLRSDEKKREKTELVLIITPKIIDDSAALDASFRRFSDALRLLDLSAAP
jgi:general secretion pathway protein D